MHTGLNIVVFAGVVSALGGLFAVVMYNGVKTYLATRDGKKYKQLPVTEEDFKETETELTGFCFKLN